MGMSKSRIAYSDCYELFEQALVSPLGLEITECRAAWLRRRLNYVRALDRTDNAAIFKPGDPLYARSEFDAISLEVRDATTLILRKPVITAYKIRELDDSDVKQEPTPSNSGPDQGEGT